MEMWESTWTPIWALVISELHGDGDVKVLWSTPNPIAFNLLIVPNHTPTPIPLSSTHTIQFIEFTYCHDRFPEQAITQKQAKYDPLINAIQNKRRKINPLITITVGLRGATHEDQHQKTHEKYTSKCHKLPNIPCTQQKETWQQTNSHRTPLKLDTIDWPSTDRAHLPKEA